MCISESNENIIWLGVILDFKMLKRQKFLKQTNFGNIMLFLKWLFGKFENYGYFCIGWKWLGEYGIKQKQKQSYWMVSFFHSSLFLTISRTFQNWKPAKTTKTIVAAIKISLQGFSIPKICDHCGFISRICPMSDCPSQLQKL